MNPGWACTHNGFQVSCNDSVFKTGPVAGRGTTVYRRYEVWLVVDFEDEAAYRANAADPQTDQMAHKYQLMMAAPPEWHDGEIVSMTRAEDRAST